MLMPILKMSVDVKIFNLNDRPRFFTILKITPNGPSLLTLKAKKFPTPSSASATSTEWNHRRNEQVVPIGEGKWDFYHLEHIHVVDHLEKCSNFYAVLGTQYVSVPFSGSD
jgi:hypothetical protein